MKKSSISNFILGAIAVVFGLFVILNSATVVNLIALAFSFVLFARGMRTLINTLRFDSVAGKIIKEGEEIDPEARKKVRSSMLVNAAIAALPGLVALIVSIVALAKGSGTILRAMVYVVAGGFLISGIAGIIENKGLKEWEGMGDILGEKAFVQLIIAVVLFIFPSLIGNVFMNVLGALIIGLGVLLITRGVFEVKEEQKAKEKVEDVEWKDADNN